jgi:hypothetical protein
MGSLISVAYAVMSPAEAKPGDLDFDCEVKKKNIALNGRAVSIRPQTMSIKKPGRKGDGPAWCQT